MQNGKNACRTLTGLDARLLSAATALSEAAPSPPSKTRTFEQRLELAATFLVSAAMLGIQICWSRIFSFLIWYHFAFLVISTAMLGFTVGGLLLHLRPHWLDRRPAELLLPSALGFSAGAGLAL